MGEYQASHSNQEKEPPLLTDNVHELTFTVRHAEGLHARPAALFVRTAMGFDSEIEVLREGKIANAKSLISLLSLAVVQNTEVKVRARGEDAQAAVETLRQLVESNFGD